MSNPVGGASTVQKLNFHSFFFLNGFQNPHPPIHSGMHALWVAPRKGPMCPPAPPFVTRRGGGPRNRTKYPLSIHTPVKQPPTHSLLPSFFQLEAMPMTPPAMRGPELPVTSDCSCPPCYVVCVGGVWVGKRSGLAGSLLRTYTHSLSWPRSRHPDHTRKSSSMTTNKPTHRRDTQKHKHAPARGRPPAP